MKICFFIWFTWYAYLPTIPILAELFRFFNSNSEFRFLKSKFRFFGKSVYWWNYLNFMIVYSTPGMVVKVNLFQTVQKNATFTCWKFKKFLSWEGGHPPPTPSTRSGASRPRVEFRILIFYSEKLAGMIILNLLSWL